MRPAGDAADLDRLRGQLGVLLARALRAPRRRHRHGRPGLASEARAAGAGTVHWDMYLRKRVGTPSDPADPALIEKRADALFDYAVEVSGCQTPLIALNELWGVVAPDTAHAERRALSRERPPLRQPAQRARRTAGAPRLERAVHGRRRRGLVEVRRRGVRSRAREVREREPHLARRCRRRIASPSSSLPRVRREASCARHPAVADRAHDRLPDRAGHRRTRGAAAALALVRRHEVAGAGRTSGRARAQGLARLVVGLGAARRTLERPGQDVRGVRLALVTRRESLRRARDTRATSSTPT